MNPAMAIYWITAFSSICTALYFSLMNNSRIDGIRLLLLQFSALILSLLAISKQFDIQQALTGKARVHAHNRGWYDERRKVQRAVLFLAILSITYTWLFLFPKSISLGFPSLLLITGLMVLISVNVVYAISLNRTDRFMRRKVLGRPLHYCLNATGITLTHVALLSSLVRGL